MATTPSSPSVLSIEPAVARQIIARAQDDVAGSSQAKIPESLDTERLAGTEKRPRKRLSQDEKRGADAPAASQERSGRTKNNSLRRVKNSKELLRERSVKRIRVHDTDAHAISKEGRNFTVGNVGTGGLIYLR